MPRLTRGMGDPMSRFATITGTKTNTTGTKHCLFVKAGLVKHTRVISMVRYLWARLTGQAVVVAVPVCVDRMAASRRRHALERKTLALVSARLGWRQARGSGGAPSGF